MCTDPHAYLPHCCVTYRSTHFQPTTMQVAGEIQCPICSTNRATCSITRHVNTHSGPARYPVDFALQCGIHVCSCGNGYTSAQKLARHRRRHHCPANAPPCYRSPVQVTCDPLTITLSRGTLGSVVSGRSIVLGLPYCTPFISKYK